ncbi:MAG: UDP-2,3-diacylglucosamine diphosphatase [Bacteroidota bacterium]|nr:UDP-2,3-diacylglucosamine diphosphatase [Bacteroidota bacterium]
MKGNIYFISDFHFGIPNRERSKVREDLFINWLESVKKDAAEIYLMGDLFDFWFEYKTVVPRGYIRLLGKLASLSDQGIRIHLFRGNHDMWAFDYLEKEMNITLHRAPEFHIFNGKTFYIGHGDGLGPGDYGYKFIKRVFQCRFNQWLFRWLHPDWGIRLGLYWSRKSRYANQSKNNREQLDRKLIRSRLTVHSLEILKSHPGIDYFIYGHWHTPWDIQLTDTCHQISLGDWLTHFTYAVFDGTDVKLMNFTDPKEIYLPQKMEIPVSKE